MLQQILVLLIFAAAVGYLSRLAYRAFFHKQVCETGCGKCSAIDVDKIERQIKERMG